MNETDALELVREAMWTVIVVSAPAVAAAMLVGIVIALFQALTQVQEVTLTFVPKILVIFAVMVLSAPFAASELSSFSEVVYARITQGNE